jgi:hypothetical protein
MREQSLLLVLQGRARCNVKGGEKKKEKKQKKLSNTYTKVDKKVHHTYLLKRKDQKVVALKINKQDNNG